MTRFAIPVSAFLIVLSCLTVPVFVINISSILGCLTFLIIVAGIIAAVVTRIREHTQKKNIRPQTSSSVDEKPAVILTCATCGTKNQNDRLVCFRCSRPLHQKSRTEEVAEDESETM
jgi:uncharacterized paraquat-inducible protein A